MGNLESKETVTFTSPEEMYQYVVSGERDLYNLETENYLFKYNEVGSIAVYNLSREEAEELEEKASEGNEYWGAYLGVGGSIYDDEDYEYRTCEETNMDYFKEKFAEGKWIDVTH